jgi:ATP-dependent HslUV protease ATP-binding subunit HslU
MDTMTPREIVAELDRYIVGQDKAKRAVAVALRNRMRRRLLPESMRDEVSPKNILMIGPTGVGKTEIARRLAKLCGAPFVKVEATKYTEVGYVGRDVESMIRDLMTAGYTMVRQEMRAQVREAAVKRVDELILDALVPGSRPSEEAPRPLASLAELLSGRRPQAPEAEAGHRPEEGGGAAGGEALRERFRLMLAEGALEERRIEVTLSPAATPPAIEIFSGGASEEMEMNFSGLANLLGGKRKKKTMTVAEARKALLAEEMDKLIDHDRVAEEARRRVEEMGIVFIDEIDKIANREGRGAGGADVSREGVQRDILPIVEGSTVNTKYGAVDTSHILFIAAGAFNVSKPQDLIPELQGRFPIRVELEPLAASDFVRILTEPENALTRQYVELLRTEGLELEIVPEAVNRIAEIAQEVNARNENIGARRLHTIMERLLEDLSYDAPAMKGQTVKVDRAYVEERFRDFFERQDLSRYIL